MSGDIPVGLFSAYFRPYPLFVYVSFRCPCLVYIWTTYYVRSGALRNLPSFSLIVLSTSIISSFVVYSFALVLSFTCIYTCILQRGFLEFFSSDFLLQVSSSFPLFSIYSLINFGFPPAVNECSPRLGSCPYTGLWTPRGIF
jgi:hypothetical protein